MAEKTTLLFRLVVLIIYTSLGSLVFSYIEVKRISREEQKEKMVHDISVLLIKEQSCAVNLCSTKLQAFVEQFFKEMNGESNETWRFKDGLTFSFELLTTIGKCTRYILELEVTFVYLYGENEKIPSLRWWGRMD